MPTKKTAKKKEETRTYLVERNDGRIFKITVPDHWRCTFGRAWTSDGGGGRYPSAPMALRFYEAENKQRAVFTGIRGFRDLSLPVEYQVVEDNGVETWTRDSEGNSTTVMETSRTSHFRDAGAVVDNGPLPF